LISNGKGEVTDLDAREVLLTKQLAKITVELEQTTSNLANARTEQEFEKASEARTQTLLKHQNILAGLAALQHARAAREASEKASSELKERERKEKLAQKVMKSKMLCPDCGSLAKPVEKPKQPCGLTGGVWTIPNAPKSWWIDFACTQDPMKCGLRFRVYPDLEKQSWERQNKK
jgi:hypothetical protein